ncbi:carbohydrate ABC transporter permease [Clostridium sp. C2-6-12]|uniref:carbohydrate ABC transporter permease n=1 Tax=Clostridium sp. C2-6-12 TaxID=2698832 RepID=UPI00136C9C64|nr:carbohydrate ABC transporter permease [Clostridium sp. C2-6-12]
MKKKSRSTILRYVILVVVGIVMIYPVVWLFFASFKSNDELFGSAALLPKAFTWDSYIEGWKGTGQYGYSTFFLNTIKLVIPTVVFTVISSAVVAYGFARFKFPFKKILFALMISTLMLPNAVVIIPKYMLFRDLGWIDSYNPFIVPAIFAGYPFFIFMLVQFFRGVPRELDEAATIDGCNSFTIFLRIMLPLSKPALFSAGIFQFMWTWNDFFNSLVYINSVSKLTLPLALRISLDASAAVNWNQIMAMALVSILPCILIFFFAQKHFVEGIATTGMKG